MMKRTVFSLLLIAALLCAAIPCLTIPASAADKIDMKPMFGQPFQPEGMIFGQVSFIVPGGTQGLTKDAWDDNIDHNTDLILVSFVKDGVAYENMTIRQVKAQFGDLALKRTCYTYDDLPDGTIRLNLVLHMDDHATLKPSDFTAITVKAGFVWCAGSPTGITNEVPSLTLDHDVSYPVNAQAGITGVQTGPMPGIDGALRIKFERRDSESLKAISTVDLCPSAIPGKTLGDLVTINGETVTELVAKGNVARLCFYGDTLIFHIDDPAYLAALKEQEYEIVILPGFRWMNWHQDDWGNWSGTNKDNYTPVDGTLVLEPISFTVDAADEVCIKTDGMEVLPGYKETYYVGESIDMRSLTVRINYVNGTSLEMMLTEDMVSYDFSQAGEATVTVEYEGMQATFTVTVLEAPESDSDTTEPDTTEPDTTESGESQPDSTEQPTQPEQSESADLVPEPGVDNKGCGAVILPASLIALAAAALLLRKKED